MKSHIAPILTAALGLLVLLSGCAQATSEATTVTAIPRSTPAGVSTPVATLAATESAAPTRAAPGATPAVPVPVITPPVIPLGTDVIAIYHKTGCFAGVNDTLTVHASGKLELTDRLGNQTLSQVTTEQLKNLQTSLGDPAFGQLQPIYSAAGADLCIYTVATAGPDGATRAVTTMDAADPPDILIKVIGELENLRRAVR